MAGFIVVLMAAQMQAVTVPAVAQTQPSAPAGVQADDDTPEEIAEDAARDLKDNRFYNKPGATRAEYDAAWQECRLIARGSRTPSGSYTYVYNPNVISPVAAGVGAGIGSLIGQAIVEGQLRRANRRTCLLIKGWNLVTVEAEEATRVAAMSDADRDTYFNAIVGASETKGKKLVQWTNDFAAPRLAPESEQ